MVSLAYSNAKWGFSYAPYLLARSGVSLSSSLQDIVQNATKLIRNKEINVFIFKVLIIKF